MTQKRRPTDGVSSLRFCGGSFIWLWWSRVGVGQRHRGPRPWFGRGGRARARAGVSDPDRAVGTGGARPAGPTVRWRARRRRCTSKGPLPTDGLGLVQGVQGFCQGACVGVCLGPHRGHRLAVGQGLPIADGAVLDFAVASGGSGPLGSAPSLWRCQIPMSRASRARSVYRLVKVVCQSTIRREFTSVTKAMYTHPDNVRR